MTINRIDQPAEFSGPSLDAFSAATRLGESVYISVDGRSLKVLGTGTTPDGRSVAWVSPDTDTASAFAQALKQTYGQGIANTVTRELGLAPSPGKPLSSRLIERAIDMARTSQTVMDGIDFTTILGCSARSNGTIFIDVCRQAGISPESLDAEARRHIDTAMRQKFEQALQSGASPVEPGTARAWLRELLARQR